MPAKEYPQHDQQDITKEHSFDELARGMADDTLTRVRMLKLMGATLFGGLIATTGFPDIAEAKRRRRKKRCKPKPAGAPCQTSKQCCTKKTKRICAVASNAGNSDTTCCGATGATCGPKDGNGDDTAPFCCAGFSCTGGVCQPAP